MTGVIKSEETDNTGVVDETVVNWDPGRKLWVRCLMQVLWPAFIGAAITVGLLFSLIDPIQIEWVNVYLQDSRQASYTIGFLIFWGLFTITCSVTWYLATTEMPTDPGRRQR